MKALIVVLALAFIQLIGFTQSKGSVKTETVEFKVYGNCGMCKNRIEKALKVDGVESAGWDANSKMVTVVYDKKNITKDQLHELVAEAGHDTDLVRAEDETYNKLHSCCKYERAEIIMEEANDSHQHSGAGAKTKHSCCGKK